MKAFAVILAAGRSVRFGDDKLWTLLGGTPLWTSSYNAFLKHPGISGVGLVVAAERVDDTKDLASEAAFVLGGGKSRQASSQIGVRAVPPEYDTVLIHDAARPFVDPTLIERVLQGVQEAGAAFPAVPQTDTVKMGSGTAWTTPDRSTVVAVQTPQGAGREMLLSAFHRAVGEFTDEASLLESLGIPVLAVPGDIANIKVTHPGDLSRILLHVDTRTGLGYDVHAFSSDPNRPLWLGGIEFDDRPGLEGHSDADALLHAIVDALLGAANLGDIGLLYPNTDPRWKDARSEIFLQETGNLLRSHGWEIRHIDATVVAERPKVMPRRKEICDRIATMAGISADGVSVKATTNEGLGAIGRSEGIAAFVVATIFRADR